MGKLLHNMDIQHCCFLAGMVEYAIMMSHPQSLVLREGVRLMLCMLTIHVLFVVVAVDVKLVNILL